MWRYLTSAGLARLANEMVVVGVLLLVLDRTDNKLLISVAVAAYTVPSMVSGPVLGAWIDRARSPLIALAGNQFVQATMTLGMVFVPVGWVPVLAFVAGIALPMTSGGYTSMLPRLPGDLPRLTAFDSMLFNASAIGGPAAAGAIAALASPSAAMVVTGVVALVSGISALGLTLAPAPASSHASMGQALRAGMQTMVRTPPLRAATVTSAVSFVGFGLLVTALPWFVESVGSDRRYVGAVMAVFEAGALTSVFLLRRHLTRWLPERIVLVTVGLYGVSFALLALVGDLAWLLVVAVLAGLASGPTLVGLITTRQRYTPPDLLGQVSTTGASLKIGAFSLGALGAGPLLSVVSPASVVLVVAVLQFAAVGAGLLGGRGAVAPIGGHR